MAAKREWCHAWFPEEKEMVSEMGSKKEVASRLVLIGVDYIYMLRIKVGPEIKSNQTGSLGFSWLYE